jgi:hypothetical protein
MAVMTPARVLYVVSRDRPDLYASLRGTFMESLRLGIVLDRRGAAGTAAESDRRHLALEESLRTRGWARVRIEPDGRMIVSEPALSTENRARPSY